MFINTIPVRVELQPDENVLDCLRRLQRQQFAAREYEYTPLVNVHGWSAVPRGGVMFESILVFENYPMGNLEKRHSSAPTVSDVRAIERTNYPLCLIVGHVPELRFRLLYDVKRFASDTIQRMLAHLATLLESIVANPTARVVDLRFLTPRERRQVVGEWSVGRTRPFEDLTIDRAFSKQSQYTPKRTAAVYGDKSITFGELDHRSNQLAQHLRSMGLAEGSRIGIELERSIDLLVAMLGILKAGALYIPLDPTYPSERLRFMIKDSVAALIITRAGLLRLVPRSHVHILCIDRDWNKVARHSGTPISNTARSNALAYILYTSGSTGRPKGVMSEHRASMNRFAWMWDQFPFEVGDITAVKTTLNFVDSVWEIFGGLLKGVPIVLLAEDDVRDPVRLVNQLAAYKITRIVLVPSLLREVLHVGGDLASRLPHLKLWTSSGEALTSDLVKLFYDRLPGRTLLNLYGSSEIAGDATAFVCPAYSPLDTIPIGRPIDNTCAYILDQYLEPVPVGVAGELCIGGANLARGYLGRPDLTAEKFIPDPFGTSVTGRLFRTGDLARFGLEGRIEFV